MGKCQYYSTFLPLRSTPILSNFHRVVPRNGFANKLKNKRRSPDARPSEGERSADLLAAFALLDRLPSLLPNDPALATIIAEAMAEEFGVMLAIARIRKEYNLVEKGE